MNNNLLANEFVKYTLEDILFEKQLQEQIANNESLSIARRRDAMDKMMLIEEVEGVFDIALENDFTIEGKTAIQMIEEITGKTVTQMKKEQNPGVVKSTMTTVDRGLEKAVDMGVSGINKLGKWLVQATETPKK